MAGSGKACEARERDFAAFSVRFQSIKQQLAFQKNSGKRRFLLSDVAEDAMDSENSLLGLCHWPRAIARLVESRMNLQYWVPILALIVAVYGAFLQRKQVKLMAPLAEGSPPSTTKPWWQAPTVLALAFLAALSWGPLIISIMRGSTVSQATIGVMAWGLLNPQDMTMHINATVLADDASNKLMGITFHYRGDTDLMDVKQLQKSALYDIRRGNQIVMMKGDSDFTAEFNAGQHGTNYMLLVVPAAFDRNQFSTLRQALAAGAKIVWGGAGPP